LVPSIVSNDQPRSRSSRRESTFGLAMNPNQPPVTAGLTRTVLATPAGRGAVATVLVSGPDALRAVSTHFAAAGGQPLVGFPFDRVVFGRWLGDGFAEDVVVCRRREELIELHCHGGHAAVSHVLGALAQAGCRPQAWQDWLVTGRHVSIKVQARIALAQACTRRTAAILLDQLRGALQDAAEGVVAQVRAGQTAPAAQRLQELLHLGALGTHLTAPWCVVLAGPPNSGKSSLVNALLGYPRAIVFDQPGTTRDVLSTVAAVDGWPVEVCDTAGLHASTDPLEVAGMARAQRQLTSADLVLLVADASQPWTAALDSLVQQWPEALLVHSHGDLVRGPLDDRPRGRVTSAVTGAGLDRLMGDIVERLVPRPPPAGAAVPFTTAQVDQLERAATALARDDTAAAIAALEPLLVPARGEISQDSTAP
jgi:tRNA modification GTPase